MVYETAIDTTFSIHYRRETDRFKIEAQSELPPYSIARLELGDEDDFILFNNERAGHIISATHSGTSHLAITTLTRIVFDHDYPLLCESIHEGSIIYDTPERRGMIHVPYSNTRRLGRIALHALAQGSSPEVRTLQRKILDSLARTTGGDVDDEYLQPLT